MNLLIGARELSLDLIHTLESSGVVLFNGDQLGRLSPTISDQDRVYLSTERYLPEVMSRLQSEDRKRQIELLKDKYLFRNLIQSHFTDFEFALGSQWDAFLSKSKASEFIVKPRKGFFGVGVTKVTRDELRSSGESILKSLVSQVRATVGGALASSFALDKADVPQDSDEKSSLFDHFIIEECIPGSEFSVDMYYDSQGAPVILNICAHPEHEMKEFSNALYYSSYSVFTEGYARVNPLFEEFNQSFRARSFPIHAEFKMSLDGQLIPVEFNPLRFGGFGLSDLPYYAFGFNPIEYFFYDSRPDWKRIWRDRPTQCYGWVLKYNPIHFSPHYYPDHKNFKKIFSKVLNYREIDFKTHPVSGVAYIEEFSKDDLFKVLKIDFNSF